MASTNSSSSGLVRQLGLLGLVSTGVCSMMGASIYVVPFMIQRNVPGIGPYVVPAFVFAAIPALLAAAAFASLSSAMPRAGGSYIYASRGLSPYLGFVASFSQWFGLSFVIGVIAYIIVPFFRDIAIALNGHSLANTLSTGGVRTSIALVLVWTFIWINIRGIKAYERIVVPLMVLMFAIGLIVIVAGFTYTQEDFVTAAQNAGHQIEMSPDVSFSWPIFLAASSILFSSFIGFDSIAQAGGEARYPSRLLPDAIGISIFVVSTFYFLFTSAVYNLVPWNFIAVQAQQQDITAPGLMSYMLSPGWTTIIIAGAAIALLNDLPAMLLSVSRLMFAWAEDGIFPKDIARVHKRYKTPHVALVFSGLIASLGVLGSHFAGDFFLGVDIMVTSMQVTFLLMCITVLTLPHVNPGLAKKIKAFRSRKVQLLIGVLGTFTLLSFLAIHTLKDLTSEAAAWYYHPTYIWVIVMTLGSVVYFLETRKLRKTGKNMKELFSQLPPE